MMLKILYLFFVFHRGFLFYRKVNLFTNHKKSYKNKKPKVGGSILLPLLNAQLRHIYRKGSLIVRFSNHLLTGTDR